MTEIVNLLSQIFQQHGLIGLIVGFLILGPGFTYFRTRTIRVQAEVKTQALLNEFAIQERQRADRLEEQLNNTLRKLDNAEEEISKLRLKLAETRNDLGDVSRLRQQVRKLTRRVRELEETVEKKRVENERLLQALKQREGELEQNQRPLHEPE